MLAVAHGVRDELRRGSCGWTSRHPGRRPVAREHAGRRHCLTGAWALRRFVTTPEATQAMNWPSDAGMPADRVRAPIHATLWSSVTRPGTPLAP